MSSKAKASHQAMQIDGAGDERTQISKKISWVLRRGARTAALKIDIDDKGWVKIADLTKYEALADFDIQTIVKVIHESNTAKARYEVSPDGIMVRAYEKHERQSMNTQLYESPEARAAGTTSDAPAAAAAQPAATTHYDDAAQVAAASNPYAQQAAAASPYDAAAQAAAAAAASPYSAWPGMAQQMAYPHMMNPWMAALYQQQAAVQAQTASAMAGRSQGRIKSFNFEKGYGFIECEQTHATFQRDVFLNREQIGDLQVNQFVTFICETNKQGMPQAKDVRPWGAPAPPPPMEGAPAGGKGKGKGKKGDGKGKGKGKGQKGGEKGKGKGQKGGEKGDQNQTQETTNA